MRNPNASARPFSTLRWSGTLVGALLTAVISAACGTTAKSAATPAADATTDVQLADTSDAKAAADATAPKDSVVAKEVSPAACSPISNTGCESGMHCAYSEAGDKACEANGTHGVGEDCADDGGCKVGICVTSPTGDKACAPFCATHAACDSNSCNQITGKTYKVCEVGKTTIVPCDPFAQDCKKPGQGCAFYNGEFTCISVGAAANGEKCESYADCASGLYCVGGPNGLCRKICHTKGATGCDDALTNCVEFGKGSPYGYCGSE